MNLVWDATKPLVRTEKAMAALVVLDAVRVSAEAWREVKLDGRD